MKTPPVNNLRMSDSPMKRLPMKRRSMKASR